MTERSRFSSPELALDQSSGLRWLKTKATALAIAIGMFPILGIGTALYYFGNQAIEQQVIEAKREGATRLAAKTLTEQKQHLALLLLGTGATALLSGVVTMAWAKRTLLSAIQMTAETKLALTEQAQHTQSQQLMQTLHRIRQAQTKAEVLRVSVEEARRALHCDRVVVYALDDDGAGTVIAESVDPKWPKTLRATIKDPCFGAQYLEAYRQGRIKATDDVSTELSACYIEQLEAFAVKANLVTPIMNGTTLFGLLIAHQCAAPRHWEQGEIDALAQIATQVGISLDNARFQGQAAAEARINQLLPQATYQLREATHEQRILNLGVEFGRKLIAADRVIVYALDENACGTVVAESVIAGYPKILKTVINDPCFGAQYLEFYRQGRVNATNDIYEAELTQCHVEQLVSYAVRANLVTPIVKGEQLFGLLIAHQCGGPRQWQAFETQWFSQLATQIGFALEKAQLSADNVELHKQAEREIEWKDFFTASTRHIHASLNPEDVLKTAVEQVRSVLACDRVLIYSVDRESMGIVIAESVGASFPKALGRRIEDPCFEARYIQKYENGRVRALNNIHDSGMTQCYIDQLDTLGVKANLVAPVLHEGKLLGLLVAHQCSGPRQWKQLEIGWFQQIAVQVGYALDNAKLVGRVHQMSQDAALEVQWKEYFTDATRQIHASLNAEAVLGTAVVEARRVLKCDRVLIYSVDRQSMGVVIAESVEPSFPKALGRRIEDPCFEARYIQQYENGRVRALNNIYESGMSQCYIDQLETLAVKANLVAPVLHEGKILGLFVAHQCSGAREWKPLEISWFKQIAVQVGYALDNAKLMGRVNQMSQNAELQQQVSALLETLSQEVQSQAGTATAAIEQINQLTEAAQEIVTLSYQTELQVQQANQTVKAGHEVVNQTVDQVANLHQFLSDASDKLKHLGLSSQKIAESLTLINDLAAQMHQEVMHLVITAGQAGGSQQPSILSAAEAVRALNEQLAETTASTEFLVTEIATEVNTVGTDIETGVEQISTGTRLAKETHAKLSELASVSAKVGMLMDQVAQAAATQVQTSTAARQITLEIVEVAHRTADRSTAVVQSFRTLPVRDAEAAIDTESNAEEP